MFGRSYRLFRILGFEVSIDLSWLIIGLLVTWSLAAGLFPYYYPNLAVRTYWVMGLAGALGLLFSIVFHELSHSLVARRYGMPIKGITLFIFGGVAHMDEEPPTAKAEFLMAVAGPVASVVLALLCYGLYRVMDAGGVAIVLTGVVGYLAYLNGLLAVFNLVPAFPLDGGRMLRAALWGWKSDLRAATRVAAGIGSGFGLVLILLGIMAFIQGNFIGGLWWFLIGMFLRNAAQMSYRQTLLREVLSGEPVSRFMRAPPVTVAKGLALDALVDGYFLKYKYSAYPVMDDGHAIGWVNTRVLRTVPAGEREHKHAADIMEPVGAEQRVAPELDAVSALSLMYRTDVSRLLVERDGKLLGIVTLRDLLKFLHMKLELDTLEA